MGYPIYKLLRQVNRQYPNNGFITPVSVTEDLTDGVIDEDLKDIINEAIQEVYKDVALDEVYTFPTVPGQNQYVLPEDCDLRDIQEVTRTYQAETVPLPPPPGPPPEPEPEYVTASFDANGGTGVMPEIEVLFGDVVILPENSFVPPTGLYFLCWSDNADNKYNPGTEITMYQDETYSAVWTDVDPRPVWEHKVTFTINPTAGNIDGESTKEYIVDTGETLEELPTVTMEDGYSFVSWSLNGIQVSNETILATPVEENLEYVAVCSAT